MAFLDIIRQKWIARNPLLIALTGFGASILGVLTAYVIFPENVGLMGLAFSSLILQPFIAKLLSYEEERKYREKRYSLKNLFKDHSQTFKTIFLIFFGILIAYSTMYLYSKEVRVKHLFGSQLSPYTNYSGSAIIGGAGGACEEPSACFFGYIQNNSIVMLLMLFLSFLYGSGAILFLAWNASVWGTVFAYIARESTLVAGNSKFSAFSSLFSKALPHTFLEASAYFLAVIAGVVIAKAFVREDWGTKRFTWVIMDGLLFFVISLVVVIIGAFVESWIYPLL
jgi:uncharacterized membrane protein SpoIIM required for sporulation